MSSLLILYQSPFPCCVSLQYFSTKGLFGRAYTHTFIIYQKSGNMYICSYTEIIQFTEYDANTIYHLPVHTCNDQDSNANHHNQHSNNQYGEEYSICKTAVPCITGQAGAEAKLLRAQKQKYITKFLIIPHKC